MRQYTSKHAKLSTTAKLPKIECWENQYKGKNYEITIVIPEYTSLCPKIGLPDFGTITIKYVPDKLCLELKSLKYYILAYRNLGIFCENAVNKILKDIVSASKPKKAIVTGDFNVRGGMKLITEAKYEKPSGKRKR